MAQSSAIFLFLRYSLGDKVDLSMVVANMDWRQLYSFATKQTIIGICFDGIKRLSEEYPEELKKNPIERDLLMTWMGVSQQIRRQNMKVNGVAAKLYSMLREDGLRCCILKGQGNALMYPNAYSRNPGDVDVWVNVSREQITDYAKTHFEIGDDIRFHHLETSFDGVPVELHFFPGIMNNPIYNARLQKWFKRYADLQCSNVVSLPDGIGEIAIPTTAFNVVYQLMHLYHHFFDEGIGMRQIIDYYYVVCDFYKVYQKSSNPSVSLSKGSSTFSPSPSSSGSGDVTAPSRCSEPLRSKVGGPSKVSPDCAGWDRRDAIGDMTSASTDTSATAARSSFAATSSITSVSPASTTDSSASTALVVVQRELEYLGLWKFAGAVMYVLKEVLGLSEDKMIVPMDEKRGRLLLAEILDGGNFGRHFTKYGHFTQQRMAKKYFLKIWRNMHFVRYYPAEALCEPLFRTWHFFWRMKNKK